MEPDVKSPPVVASHRLPQLPSMGRNMRTAQSKSSAKLIPGVDAQSTDTVLHVEGTSKVIKISNDGISELTEIKTKQTEESLVPAEISINQPDAFESKVAQTPSESAVPRKRKIGRPRKIDVSTVQPVLSPTSESCFEAKDNGIVDETAKHSYLISKSSYAQTRKQAIRKDRPLSREKRISKSKPGSKTPDKTAAGAEADNLSTEKQMSSLVGPSEVPEVNGNVVGKESAENENGPVPVHVPRQILISPGEVPNQEQLDKMLATYTELGLLQHPIQLAEGDMKWAKVTGHPYWPCMVSKCPFSKIVTRVKGDARSVRLYHVQFFGDECERGWIPEPSLMEFKGKADFVEKGKDSVKKTPKKGKSSYNPFLVKECRQNAWNLAVAEAEDAAKLTLDNRKVQYLFQYCFIDKLKKEGKLKKDKQKVLEASEKSPSPKATKGRKRKLDEWESKLESPVPQQNKEKRQKLDIGSPKTPLRKTVPFQVYFATHSSMAQEEHPEWDSEALRIFLRKQWKEERRVEPCPSQLPLTDFWKKTQPQEASAMDSGESQTPATAVQKRAPQTVLGKTNKKDTSAPHSPASSEVSGVPKHRTSSKTMDTGTSTQQTAESLGTNDEDLTSQSKRTRLPRVATTINQNQSAPSPSSLASEVSEDVSSMSEREVFVPKTASSVVLARKSSQDSDSSSEGKGRKEEPYELEILKLLSTYKIDKDKVCSVCEKSGEMVECSGHCAQHFHPACVHLEATPEQTYTCAECLSGIHSCFSCKQADESTVKCSISVCGKYYHEACLKKYRLSRFETKGFVCPMHICATCAVDNIRNPKAVKGRYFRCIRCPTSYHVGDHCIPAGSVVLAGQAIICADHFKPNKALSCHSRLNITWCFTCSKGGTLLCCEACPAAYHAECVKMEKTPEGAWYCEECDAGRRPLYGTIVWIKVGNYRWWPGEICHPRNVPLNIQEKKHHIGEFPVRFFGSHDYYWIHRGRVFLFQEGDKASRDGSAKGGLFKAYVKGVQEATEAFKTWTAIKDKKDEQEQERNDKRPAPYKFIKASVPIGNVQIYKADLSEIPICECKPDQEDACASDCLNRMMLYECHPASCPAGEKCNNQRFQKRLYPEVEPCKCENRGWGLRCLQEIKKGQFVLEYVGDLIDEEECKKRVEQAHDDNITNFYMLTLDKNRIIDAGPKGNYSRFMNHSCCPNLVTQKWTVNGDIRVGLFALEDIPKGSELTFNYNLECLGNEKKACVCGADNCSGFLGVRPKATATGAGAKEKAAKELKKKSKKKKKLEQRKIYEDECFRCGEGGELVMCDVGNCPKVYHLHCLKLSKPPTGKWRCPWHHCDVCGKHAVNKCIECPDSFCLIHSEGNIFGKNGVQVCEDHVFLLDGQAQLGENTETAAAQGPQTLRRNGPSTLETSPNENSPATNTTPSAANKCRTLNSKERTPQQRVKRKYTKKCKSQLVDPGGVKCPVLKITVPENQKSRAKGENGDIAISKADSEKFPKKSRSRSRSKSDAKHEDNDQPRLTNGVHMPLTGPVNGGSAVEQRALLSVQTIGDSDDADSASSLVIDLV